VIEDIKYNSVRDNYQFMLKVGILLMGKS